MIPGSISFPWRGTIATIPTGWVRDTDMDGYFPKGYINFGDALNVAGGALTHIHVSPAHTHTMQNHSHYGQTSRDGDYETEGGAYSGARDAHVHDYTSDNQTGGELSSGFNYGSASNLPPFHEVIWIKPAGQLAPFRANICALFAGNSKKIDNVWTPDTTVPTGFTLQSDVADKFIRGAAAGTEAETEGGSSTHSHDVSHSHPNANHVHYGRTGYDSDQGSTNHKDGNNEGGSACDRHTHAITLVNVSEAATAYSGTCPVLSNEPAHVKLALIKNTSGKVSQRNGIVGVYKGDPNKIPIGWVPLDGREGLADSRNRFVKLTATLTALGVQAGSHSHAHPDSNSHTHSATVTHNHPGSYTDYFPQNGGTTANNNGISKGHSHTINQPHGGSCSTNTSAWNGASMQGLTSNNEPPYKIVALVRLKYSMDGGAVIGFL